MQINANLAAVLLSPQRTCRRWDFFFFICSVFVEKIHAEIILSLTETVDTKAYTKVQKITRAADELGEDTPKSTKYGKTIDTFAIAYYHSCSIKTYRAHKIPGTKSRYYDERHEILVSGSNFSIFDLKF